MTRTVLPHWQSEQTPKARGDAPELRSLTPAKRGLSRFRLWCEINPGATADEISEAWHRIDTGCEAPATGDNHAAA